jgi:predicted Zn-dependent peptidase
VYSLSAGSQEITKIEFLFKAGMYYQPATLIASGTNSLLESGTSKFTADELSEGIDFLGSFLELQVEQDFACITVYSLNKYVSQTLAYIEELIKHPSYPEDEFRIYYGNKRQKHAINSQKVSVLARRRFAELLFGEQHPYGRDVKDADYERISIAELKDFFSKHYNSMNCTIMTAGNLPANLMDELEKYFGSTWGQQSGTPIIQATKAITVKGKHLIEREDAIQSAIRVGRLLFNKTHPDYFKFQVLNSILGGYFGSRLMANIREDKGYTYGIGSGLTNLVHDGYFFISTEVGAEVTSNTLKEIYKEIKILRTDLVDTSELETVRNYMLGNFLRSVDGPFSLIDKFKSVWEFGLDYSFFEQYFHAVKTVTPQDLRELANKYLQEDDLVECVAGKMK